MSLSNLSLPKDKFTLKKRHASHLLGTHHLWWYYSWIVAVSFVLTGMYVDAPSSVCLQFLCPQGSVCHSLFCVLCCRFSVQCLAFPIRTNYCLPFIHSTQLLFNSFRISSSDFILFLGAILFGIRCLQVALGEGGRGWHRESQLDILFGA